MDLYLLEQELSRDEGRASMPYKDTATPPNPTIGIGHNLNAEPLPSGWTVPLSDGQITQLFQNDVYTKAINPLNAGLSWWTTLDDVRQRVLANMCFNMGLNGLLQFKQTLAAIQSGDYVSASNDMQNSQWYNQVGQRAVRLCEAMKTGVMP